MSKNLKSTRETSNHNHTTQAPKFTQSKTPPPPAPPPHPRKKRKKEKQNKTK